MGLGLPKAPGFQELSSRITFAVSLPRSIIPSPVGTHIRCQQGAAYPCRARLCGAHTGAAGSSSHRGTGARSSPDTNVGIWLGTHEAPCSPER